MQTKSSWADDIEDEDPYQPKVFTDENGIKNIIEYKENDAGKKVKGPGAAPPSAGESMRGGADRRDDNCTLRVTNLSEDVTDNDIHDLFRRFGNITRVFLARDRETRMCKGFAFVSFADREDADRAQQAVNGYGYDNLILRVEFARSQ
ncbi:hypothetical protein [Absidia glauca]|uniref:RRM domain-containing protein n=1 Tax=Absidia glauca TaxID=4829 RepID=A0A163M0L1_ABSGL|nr:hypothetical protein [Absidia glauca]